MTFSIVARCPRTGQFGVAAATAMPAIGKLLTHAAAHVGAVASAGQLCAKGWARGLPSMPATTCVHR